MLLIQEGLYRSTVLFRPTYPAVVLDCDQSALTMIHSRILCLHSISEISTTDATSKTLTRCRFPVISPPVHRSRSLVSGLSHRNTVRSLSSSALPFFCADWGFVSEDFSFHPSESLQHSWIDAIVSFDTSLRFTSEVTSFAALSNDLSATQQDTLRIIHIAHQGDCMNNQLTSTPFCRFLRDCLVFSLLS